MKFYDIRKFGGKTLHDVLKYLTMEYNRGVRDLSVGLVNLSILENVGGFPWEGTISAGATVTIENILGQIPSGRLVIGSVGLTAGTIIIDDSQTPWTSETLYLRNGGTADVKAKVYFLK
jgi:hypothetical protein